MQVVRRQAVDLSTSKGIPPSTPDDCTFNLADSGVLSPNYPVETGMEFAVTSVCFPHMVTAVQNYNARFFVTTGDGTVYVIRLDNQNFTGMKGMATVVQATLRSVMPTVAWVVTANEAVNTLTFSLPSTISTTYSISFKDQIANGTVVRAFTSACKLLGFRQSDIMTLTPSAPTVSSTVPCQAGGDRIVYIACDLFSLEGATVDILDATRRGSIIGKLQLCDQPYTTATYQDQLTTFTLKLPPFSVSQFTVFLLNEDLQKVGQPVDWSFTVLVKYFGDDPIVDVQKRLASIEELVRYIFLKLQHDKEDIKKQLKLQNEFRLMLEKFQGRPVE